MNRLVAAFALAQAVFIAGVLALPGKRSPSEAGFAAGAGSWEPRAALRTTWTHVIVHHSASPTGSAAHFDRAHRDKGWEGLGYHFVIGNGSMTENGRVEAGERWVEQRDGAHAKPEWNGRAIGICLVGDFEKAEPSAEQVASLQSLCSWLSRRCGIPPDNVLGHGETHGNATLCPGRKLDMGALRRRLKEGR
ncbi:MAG: N-acetylmuramoyl-L-alanine amidase [Planctomycetes bacterium]|nr:N-acetylmuramoyl-L-alanine amidase [Planctomycetota bacterium]